MHTSLEERFWSKVDRSGGPDACWLWTGAAISTGYGWLWIAGRGPQRTSVLAHRFSWELHNAQAIPDQLVICHRCDNPPCVNPGHLFLGTQTDNVSDKVAKGRARTNGFETKTHCPQGHEYDLANTYVSKTGNRACRTCQRIRSRQYELVRPHRPHRAH